MTRRSRTPTDARRQLQLSSRPFALAVFLLRDGGVVVILSISSAGWEALFCSSSLSAKELRNFGVGLDAH